MLIVTTNEIAGRQTTEHLGVVSGDAIVGANQTTGLDVSPDRSLLAYSDFLDNRVVIYRIPPYEEPVAGGGGRWEQNLVEKVK